MGVSIIVPTYNDGHFLPTALESCASQKLMEKEIIIIDDASDKPIPDKVSYFMERYPFVRYIRHDENRGLAAARNTAIKEAKFEYIIPLDADDNFYPDTVRKMENFMTEDVDVVYGDVFDNNLHKPQMQPFSVEMFKAGNPLFCSSLFRKSLWEKVGGYMERKGPHYEDWNFWARCFKAGARFRYIPITVYNHQSRPDGMLRVLHPNREFYQKLATNGVFDESCDLGSSAS